MLTEEERRERKRESSRRYWKEHPLTDEQRERKNARAREKRRQKKLGVDTINGTARHPYIDVKIVSKSETKKRQERRKKAITEIEEARAMGISYGKYRMLKEHGKLPRYIPIAEKQKPKKLGVYVPAERGLKEFNESRERMFEVAAGRIMEERRQKRARVKAVDATANNYMERMKRQKEAVEHATAGSNQRNS